jgi:phospholipid/cholesterol/gamma-HCH transport system substrate-binding protein
MTLDPKTYLVTVHMNVREDIKIPADSSVMVTSSGFLGSQYLSITPGGDDRKMAAGEFFESAQGSIDVMGLVNRFATGAGSSGGQQPAAPKPLAPPALGDGP